MIKLRVDRVQQIEIHDNNNDGGQIECCNSRKLTFLRTTEMLILFYNRAKQTTDHEKKRNKSIIVFIILHERTYDRKINELYMEKSMKRLYNMIIGRKCIITRYLSSTVKSSIPTVKRLNEGHHFPPFRRRYANFVLKLWLMLGKNGFRT